MKSGKQRRADLKAQRKKREAKAFAAARNEAILAGVTVDVKNLAPYHPFDLDLPDFITRGFYTDQKLHCQSCGRCEVWTARRQKWWYEVAKGDIHSVARLCRLCRRQENERRTEARRIHLEGLAKKMNQDRGNGV